jgi:hypothetical protein
MKLSDEQAGQILYEIEMARRTNTARPVIPWDQAFVQEQHRCITVAKEFLANIERAQQAREEKPEETDLKA